MLRFNLYLVLFASLCLVSSHPTDFHFEYSSVELGIFQQENPSINSNPADYATSNLGLLNRPYPTDRLFDPKEEDTQWERFEYYVQHLNEKSPDVQYKVFYLARHGEGYHNVAQSYYGTNCWDCYWSQREGNGSISWLDARLTPKGHKHAQKANKFWRDSFSESRVPFPGSFYTSPLYRCLDTVDLTFKDLPIWGGKLFSPIVKESLREPISACTCARRAPSSSISKDFPTFTLEPDFPPEDFSWQAGYSETPSAQSLRVKQFLDDVFASDDNIYISVTSHGGLIAPILKAVDHPNAGFNLTTGQIVPALVRGERFIGARETDEAMVQGPVKVKTCELCGP